MQAQERESKTRTFESEDAVTTLCFQIIKVNLCFERGNLYVEKEIYVVIGKFVYNLLKFFSGWCGGF